MGLSAGVPSRKAVPVPCGTHPPPSNMKRSHCTAALRLVLCGILLSVPLAAGAVEFHWTGQGTNDNWYSTRYLGTDDYGNPLYINNWGEAVATPGAGDHATIGAFGASLANGDHPEVQELTLGSGALLIVADGGRLGVNGGPLTNHSELRLAYGGYGGGGHLVLGGSTISGSGAVVFGTGTIDGNGTLAAGHLIRGQGGTVNATLTNNGTINADVASQWLRLADGEKTNLALLAASNGGKLEIHCPVVQGTAGTVQAGDGSSVMYFTGSSVAGGTTAATGSGLHTISGGGISTTLQDIANTGHWLAQDGAVVELAGSAMTNPGVFELGGYTGGSGWATLRAAADVALTGTGSVFLNPGILASAAGMTLTNDADHTIHGYGTLSAQLVNLGTVAGDHNGQPIALNTNPKQNRGVIKATDGGRIDLSAAITQDTGGTLLAEDGALVRYFNGSSVAGGTTATTGSGLHTISGGGIITTLRDIANTGHWFAQDGAVVELAGATMTNSGVFELGGYTGGSGWATLRPADGLSLQGTGTLVLAPGNVNSPAPATITNAAGHTIRASWANIYANVTLDNLGTIEANGGTFTIHQTPLQFSGTTLTAGVWKATGGVLAIGGSPSVVQNQATVILTGTSSSFAPIDALARNDGDFTLLGGRDFGTVGELVNHGRVHLGAGSKLTVAGAYTQAGTLAAGIEGYGTAHCGWLHANGSASLSGTVDVVVGGSFLPAPGDRFTILTSGSDSSASGLQVAAEDADRWALVWNSPRQLQLEFTTTALDLYQEWIGAAGLSGDDALPGAQPYADSVTNLQKYAFNLDPTRGDCRTLTPATGTAGLPVLSAVPAAAPQTLRFEFLRRKGSGLVYAPEVSTTLEPGSFVPLAGVPTITAIDAQWERVAIDLVWDPVGNPRRFVRVVVTLP